MGVFSVCPARRPGSGLVYLVGVEQWLGPHGSGPVQDSPLLALWSCLPLLPPGCRDFRLLLGLRGCTGSSVVPGPCGCGAQGQRASLMEKTKPILVLLVETPSPYLFETQFHYLENEWIEQESFWRFLQPLAWGTPWMEVFLSWKLRTRNRRAELQEREGILGTKHLPSCFLKWHCCHPSGQVGGDSFGRTPSPQKEGRRSWRWCEGG